MHTNPTLNLPIFVDRSRIETEQHCSRERFLHYHAEDTGLSPVRNKLALVVGGAFHEGIRPVLEAFRDEELVAGYLKGYCPELPNIEEVAVNTALAYFHANFGAGLEMDGQERQSLWDAARAPQSPQQDPLVAALEASLGETYDQCLTCGQIETPAKHTSLEGTLRSPDGTVAPHTLLACSQCLGTTLKRVGDADPADPNAPPETVVTRFDRYLRAEQGALVEAMMRAYMRRRLRPLLEEFQILEVEREGVWTLAEVHQRGGLTWEGDKPVYTNVPIIFQSRPDALLLHRATRQLQILSYKTAASVDVRRAKDAERDMQGLSEGIEVEMRLARWHAILHELDTLTHAIPRGVPDEFRHRARADATDDMIRFLRDCAEPPTISAVRYEFILKGDRYTDKKLSAEYGFQARHQRTPLLRVWIATSTPASGKNVAAFTRGDWSVSYDYIGEDGANSSLSYRNWSNEPVWEQPGFTIKKWIDLLDETAQVMSEGDPTMGTEPQPRGWGGPAQKMGFLPSHPLDLAFTQPITVYRNDDDLRDMIEQIEYQEVRVARGIAAVRAAGDDEGVRRSLLNEHFPQTRRACSYPSDCAFIDICFGSDDIRALPLQSGKYVNRVPHHAPEKEAFDGQK